MLQSSITVGVDSREISRSRSRNRESRTRRPLPPCLPEPLSGELAEAAANSNDEYVVLNSALLNCRISCLPLLRKHVVYRKKGKDSRGEMNELDEVQKLTAELRDGKVRLAAALRFLGRLTAPEARKEMIPFFLRAVVNVIKKDAGKNRACSRLMHKAGKLEAFASEIQNFTGDSEALMAMTHKSELLKKLEEILP